MTGNLTNRRRRPTLDCKHPIVIAMLASHIDRKVLWQKVEKVLEQKTTATLSEIIEITGLTGGVGEVVSYFSFLREKASRVQSMQEITELIPLDAGRTQFIEVPYLLFSR